MRLRTVALLFALAACHREPQPTHPKPGDLPPLPPASGTPVGYLIDSAGDLKLRDEQLKELKEIDTSLAARDAEIDTQLRQIEKPAEDEQEDPKQRGGPHRPKNNAPGVGIQQTGDSKKLHDIRDAQDRDALKRAFALLDADQKANATKILQDHDVEVPGAPKKAAPTADDGTPLPGGEP